MATRKAQSGLQRFSGMIVRLVLPLSGLALLSTVFLLARTVDPSRAAALQGLDLSEVTNDPRVGESRFSGVTEDGASLIVASRSTRTAQALGSPDPVVMLLQAPDGMLEFDAEDVLHFTGENGRIDMGERLLVLEGDAVLVTESGFRAQMPRVQSHLDKVEVIGEGGVTGYGPPGDIRSDALRVTAHGSPAEGHILEFVGNVVVVYWPDPDENENRDAGQDSGTDADAP